jgi:hypothetical protein
MLVRFTKGRHAETMTCVRDDASIEVFRRAHERRGYFVIHDLLHLAVESVLGYDRAFFGLIAAGWKVADFERRGAAATTPEQALRAEKIVGAIQVLGGPPLRGGDLGTSPLRDGPESATESRGTPELLAGVRAAIGEDAPEIAADNLARITSLHRDLVARWAETNEGATLELQFPLA